MKRILFLFILGILFGASSCVEIIDDLTLNEDGSGTFKYTVNLSSSKVKLNSYLALDSLDGKKVPSLDEIKTRVSGIVESIRKRNGISNVNFESNYNDYVFKISFDFKSIQALQTAIKEVVQEENSEKTLEGLNHNWITNSDNQFMRSIPNLKIDRTKNLKAEEIAELKEGTYTSITRFGKEVSKCDNKSAVIAKNKKAVMLRTDAYSLSQNPSLLDNTIYLTENTGSN